MKLKFYPGDLGRGAKLLTADGKVLIEYGVTPEFVEYTLYNHNGESMQAKIVLDEVEVIEELPVPIIDADEQSVRALPAPRRVVIEHTFPVAGSIDYEPGDYAPLVRDDEEDEEWEEED